MVAEDLDGLLPPGGALVVQRLGGVFRRPGGQVRLLGKGDHLHRRRQPPVPAQELGGQVGTQGADLPHPGRPPVVQPRVDTDDLAHRTLPHPALRVTGTGAFGEGEAKAGAEFLLEGGVVVLAAGDVEAVEHPGIQRAPIAAVGLDLVRYGDVGVQVGVTGPALPVGEHRHHQTPDLDLGGAAGADPGVAGLGFQPGQGAVDGGVVRGFDDFG